MDRRAMWDLVETHYGCLSELKTITSYRRWPQEEDEDRLSIRNPFFFDVRKILLSKASRKQGNKTQVFSFPETSLTRTRMTHVNEVLGNAVFASELLGLNTALVQAAAIGHDIGHVPFGHPGEAWLQKAMGRPEFCHEKMGVITAQKIERAGKGLNLTWHVLEAMMCHSGDMAREGMSQEAWLLNYIDKITYLFHDYNDIFKPERANSRPSPELEALVNDFGVNQRERTDTAIAGLVIESARHGKVMFKFSELAHKFKYLRQLMYQVYYKVTEQNVWRVMEPVLEFLKESGVGDPFLLLALMTDGDVHFLAEKQNRNYHAFKRTSVSEIIYRLPEIEKRWGSIDLCDPDLDW